MEDRLEATGIQIQSVARAMEIIRCFAANDSLSLAEIAKQMNLNKSTAFGIVNTLATYGFLEKDEDSKRYRLGIALFEYGSKVLARTDVRELAKRACTPLAKKYSAAVHIATHSNGGVLYLEKLVYDSVFSISSSSVGMRAPMHCTGVGKAMLAFLSEEYIRRYLHFPLESFTPNTITGREELMRELQSIRESGIAVDNEEIERGLFCVAAPVLQQDGMPSLAISLSLPLGRLEKLDLDELKADVKSCAGQITKRINPDI